MSSTEKYVDLESVLVKFELFGKYHIKLLLLVCFMTITNSWYSTNYVFVTENTKFRCKYPECEESSTTAAFHMAADKSECYKHTLLDNKNVCSYENVNFTDIVRCDEWIYEDPNSFVAEFQLACEHWKQTLIGTVHSIGYMLGLLIIGPLSDKFGRKKLIILCGISGGVLGFARSIVNSYWVYVALELTEGLIGNPYSPCFTLAIEMITKDKRVLLMSYLNAFFAIGGMLKALIAWAASDWRIYLRITYFPAILFVFYIFFMDESARWLLSKGRKDEAVEIIIKAAEVNKIDLGDDINNMKCESGTPNTDLKELLKETIISPQLLLRIVACFCMWITTTFSMYALLINSVSLEGNKYIHYGLSCFVGVPASFAITFFLGRYRRKLPLILSLGLTGTIFVTHTFIPTEYPWTGALLFYVGKFTSEIAFAVVHLYTSELFPTYTRNTMHALCSAVGRFGAILAPQTPLLAKYWPGIPSVLVGGLSLATAFIVVLIPDTSEETLPDTVLQAEALGKKQQDKHITCSRL